MMGKKPAFGKAECRFFLFYTSGETGVIPNFYSGMTPVFSTICLFFSIKRRTFKTKN
jgi:hypothetical protein